ncbi:MAG: T9SS type A sorting domain-containing protein [Flavobacteriales bacterium]|nr:T9SS type A sorting domain-containing protein [Flavobacteriales bacterium]
MDFDGATGVASNRQVVSGGNAFSKTYGVEFSPDGSKLYVSTLENPHKIIQFDATLLDGPTMWAARHTIAYVVSGANYYFGALQIGPDGHIYSAMTGNDSLGVILDPDSTGALCNYIASGVGGRICRLGLPNFVSDIVQPVTTGVPAMHAPLSLQPYPNPCDAVLNLAMPGISANDQFTLDIIDGLGRIVHQSAGNLNQVVPPVHIDPDTGMYRLRISHREDCR